MELRTGYKQTEIGDIPEDWDVTTVGKEFSIQLGKMIDAEKNFGVVKPYLGNRAVQWGKINIGEIGFVRMSPSDLQKYLLEEGDLLVCEGGEVGRAAIWREEQPECYFQKALHRLKPLRDFNVPLMVNLLWLLSSQGSLQDFVTQTSIAHLPKDKFLTVPLPLPPKKEQDAIAEALSDVDELIESFEQLIAKKRQIKQGAMQELLTGKKRLPGFDGEWEETTLGELFEISGGISASREQLGFEGYCYLHYGDIHTTTKSIVDVNSEFASLPKLNIPLSKTPTSSLLKDGDIVFVDASEDIEGASKHVVVINPDDIPFISGLHTIVAKSKSDELDHVYRRYCFQTETIREQFKFYVVGTKVSGISKANIKKIKLPVPELTEQKAIASILSDMDSDIESAETNLGKARQVKLGMMQQLLTGKIRLVQPSSNVVEDPKIKTVSTAKKSHGSEFEDAVIIGVFANHFGTEAWPLSRFKYTKFSYLLRRRAVKPIDTYLKKAAGPYNPRTRYGGPERITVQKGYSRKHSNGTYSGFIAGEKIDEAEKYFESWFGDEALKWLEQFRYEKHDQLELLTTVDMALVDLQNENTETSLESVKQLILSDPEWAPKLDRSIFSDDNIQQAINRSLRLFGKD